MFSHKWVTVHFLAGLFALWVFWFGLGVVVFLELGGRRVTDHAEGVLRRIPFHTDYLEEVKE